jgi:hypothetical protein
MSSYSRWQDIRGEYVADPGDEKAVAAGQQEHPDETKGGATPLSSRHSPSGEPQPQYAVVQSSLDQ